MRLPKTSTRPRLVVASLLLLVFGLLTLASGAKHEVLAGQAGRDQLASLHTSFAVSGGPIPTRHLTPNTPERDLARMDPAFVGAGGAVSSRPLPDSPDSGLTLVLVGLSLVGGAVFMRRITPGQLRGLRPDVVPSPTFNSVPGKRSPRSSG
jgi:hypothetical protein